ncbi:MAG: hypothetical protein V4582_18615 [Pseudomonadota bacterium]
MAFIPDAFDPPMSIAHAPFQLRVLAPALADLDYEAVVASTSRLKNIFGNNWPGDHFTFARNMSDLGMHERDFSERKAFAYSMLDQSGTKYLGCIYIDPLALERDEQTERYRAQVYFWLSCLHDELTSAQALSLLKRWFAQYWPFDEVIFPMFDSTAVTQSGAAR